MGRKAGRMNQKCCGSCPHLDFDATSDEMYCKLKDYEQIWLRWHKHRPDWCPLVTGEQKERVMAKIFCKVHCNAYLKKIDDGVHLECFLVDDTGGWKMPAEGNSWRDTNVKVEAVWSGYKDGKWQEKKIADLSGFEGETVDKTYRERVEEVFDGFLVGFTRITTAGKIGTDMTMCPYNMSGDLEEVYHLTKETKQERVGVVYFKNNSKRYVLEEDLAYEDGTGRKEVKK